jgi:hypothetical protein
MNLWSLILVTVSGFGAISMYIVFLELEIKSNVVHVADVPVWQPSQGDSCTFRVYNISGGEVILDRPYGKNCSLNEHHVRDPFVETGTDNMGSAVAMFPPINYTEPVSCKDWFFNTPEQHSGGGIAYIHGYIAQRRATSGIAKSVVYCNVNRRQNARRYLVIYAAATSDEHRRAVSNFTLRRLREALGLDTFIVAVETGANAEPLDLADVVLHSEFVSPDTFYDSAAMQEGMLEAYRLFGDALAGFYGLLIINDSLIGPVADGLADVLPGFPDAQPVVVAAAVWSRILISGAGILANRAAFSSQAFVDFWRFVRFPCGKWGSMMLWEGALRLSLVADTKSLCVTFTNDIMALNAHPDQWGALPFYKHKNSNDPAAVRRFVEAFVRGGGVAPVYECDLVFSN